MSAVPSSQSDTSIAPALNVTASANDADIKTQEPEGSTNPVKRTVDEIVALMALIHEEREELLARGIPFHTVNVMVEMGTNNKEDELADMKKTAIAMSTKQHGSAAIEPAALDERVESLIALQRDIALARKVAKSQGQDLSVINMLTMTIRQNPGDGGEKSVNTFLAYAIACGIPVNKVEEMVSEATAGPKSVLPQIDMDDINKSESDRKKLISDVLVGCVLALIAMMLFT